MITFKIKKLIVQSIRDCKINNVVYKNAIKNSWYICDVYQHYTNSFITGKVINKILKSYAKKHNITIK